MFNNERYITKGSSIKLPPYLINMLWFLIETMNAPNGEQDHFQIFDLSSDIVDGQPVQVIEHSQEIPEYKATYRINTVKAVDAKVYIIDDISHSTMLLAEEY